MKGTPPDTTSQPRRTATPPDTGPHTLTDVARQVVKEHNLDPDNPVLTTISNLALDLADFLALDLGEETWVVDGLIPEGSTAALIGSEKQGKSTIAAQIALAVAFGLPFMGRNTTQGNVLLHDEEGNARAWQRRLRKPLYGMRLTPEGTKGRIHFLHRKQVMYDDPVRMEELEAFIREKGITLCILNPLRQITNFEDENKSREINNLMRGFNRLAEKTNCSVLIVHHRRKSGRDTRVPGITEMFESSTGNNAFMGAVDSAIAIHRPSDDQPEDGLLYWRCREPSRDRPSLGKESYHYNPATYLIEQSTATFDPESAKDRRILDYLYEHGPTDTRTIAKHIDLSEDATSRRAKKLEERKKLQGAKAKDKTHRNLWDLSAEERRDGAARRGEESAPSNDWNWIDEDPVLTLLPREAEHAS